MFWNLPLRTKLIVFALIVSLIPIAIIGHVSGLAIHQALVNAANESLAGAAEQTAANLDGFIQANLDAVRTEAQLPDFGEFLDLISQPRVSSAELAQASARMATILRALSRRDQLYISSYALLDRNGIDVVDTNTSDIGLDKSSRDYFRRPLITGLPYVSPVEFSETTAQPSLYFGAPVRNAEGKTIGVLRLRYNAAVLQKIIADTKGLAGKESFAVLVDENHIRLADGETPALILKAVMPLEPAQIAELQAAARLPRQPAAQLSTNLPAFEQGLANATIQPFFRAEMDESGRTLEAVAVARVTTEPWLVAFGQDENVFLAPVEQQARDAFLIGAGLLLLVVLTVAIAARRLSDPIVRLTAVARQVGAGDLSAQAHVETTDEIGTLATTFNTMTMQLRQTLDGLAERSAELRRVNEQLEAELAERRHAEAALRESEVKYRTLVDAVNDGFYVSDPRGMLTFANRALAQILGFDHPAALIGRNFLEFVPPGNVNALAEQYQAAMSDGTSRALIITEVIRQDGARAFIEIKPTNIIEDGKPVGNRGVIRDITERKRAEEEIKQRLAELEAVNQLSTALRAAQTLDEMLPTIVDVTIGLVRATAGSIWLYDPVKDQLRLAVNRGWGAESNAHRPAPEKPGTGIAGYVFATGQSYVTREYHGDPRLPEAARQWIPPGIGGAAIPLRAANAVIGAFDVSVHLPRELTPDEIHLLTILSEIAGNAIHRTTLHAQTKRRLQHLTALSDIDRAITSTFDLRLSLATLLNHVTAQLGVDAANVLLFNPGLQTLEYASGRGFRAQAVERVRFRLGEGYAGRAALERRVVHIPNLAAQSDDPRLTQALAGEDFVSYYGVSLLAKGQIKGVLQVFQRAPLEPDEEWLDFLNTLARQCAIAIDNATLFDGLQRSNIELALAYDATIEGWSRALDLRDRETEGHTQRVTETTVRLARALGLSSEEIVHVRRGALLHDIGKMGIPDTVLLKPGALTDDEWVTMRKHPVYAYELLVPIAYLRPAADIPYCHHEKWDGSGYPRGLKGEQIPLGARIFAVVDVWDALTSDRPYRAAWDKTRARAYLREQTGKHFDPKVVEAFLRMMTQEGE
jgi:PAS domain S-box-containing protein